MRAPSVAVHVCLRFACVILLGVFLIGVIGVEHEEPFVNEDLNVDLDMDMVVAEDVVLDEDPSTVLVEAITPEGFVQQRHRPLPGSSATLEASELTMQDHGDSPVEKPPSDGRCQYILDRR